MKKGIITIVLLGLTFTVFSQNGNKIENQEQRKRRMEEQREGGIWQYVDDKAAETLQLSMEYTDQAKAEAISESNAYTDQTTLEAIDLMKSYTDQAKADAISQSNTYTDQAKVDAISESNAYTDQAKTEAISQSNAYTNQVKVDVLVESSTYTDSKIQENICPNLTWNDVGVGIGTEVIGSYTLAVEGTIGAREVKITTDAWADFVFESDYNLMSLKDLETFIQENKHLPEIPTTAEVQENGISVGEMNAKLLQKIEELTLYVIELQKEVEILKEQNK